MKKYAKVKFEGNPTQYTFMTDIDDLVLGDTLVVDTRNGLSIGRFVNYVIFPEESVLSILKWIVQKIDVKSHEEKLQKAEDRKNLKRKMQQRQLEMEELSRFSKIAKKDADMKTLLDQYEVVLDF